MPKTQLLEQMSGDEHGAPRTGVEYLDRSLFSQFFGQLLLIVIAAEKSVEHRQHGLERIPAAEVGDDLLLDPTVVTDRGDYADIFVSRTVGGADFDGADEHQKLSLRFFTLMSTNNHDTEHILANPDHILSLRFFSRIPKNTSHFSESAIRPKIQPTPVTHEAMKQEVEPVHGALHAW